MKIIFWHHEVQGPVRLQSLSEGTHQFAGSVSRLRILFWLARLGHEVILAGNVCDDELDGVRGVAVELAKGRLPDHTQSADLHVFNNVPGLEVWHALRVQLAGPVVLWAGNPFEATWMERLARNEVQRIVCVSQYHRELYRIYPGFHRVEVVYSGSDVDLLQSAAAADTPHGAVLFCSAPRRTKGVHNLLAAWPSVRRSVPSARLRICGAAHLHDPRLAVGRSGVLDRDLEVEFSGLLPSEVDVESAFGITLLGVRSLSHVYGELKAASVAVANCNWRGSFETFSRSAIEAQMAGTAIVAAARGALPEVVADGMTGLLVERESVPDLARVLVQLLQDPCLRGRLGAAGPEHAAPFASYDRIAENWSGVALRASNGSSAPAQTKPGKDLLRYAGYGLARNHVRRLLAATPIGLRMLGRG